MGPAGKPGASLRAFQNFLPNSQIFGADIDASILFSDERIKTFPVDQLDRGSLVKLGHKLNPIKFDLIIDDGLHLPNANLNTLIFGLELLKSDGILVIEDISDASLIIWQIASAILSDKYRTYLIKARGGNLFVVCGPDSDF
jgi:hypothetical protein